MKCEELSITQTSMADAESLLYSSYMHRYTYTCIYSVANERSEHERCYMYATLEQPVAIYVTAQAR